MADWSEPIRKKGCILNFQTKKLQEINDRSIVSLLKLFNYYLLKHNYLSFFS